MLTKIVKWWVYCISFVTVSCNTIESGKFVKLTNYKTVLSSESSLRPIRRDSIITFRNYDLVRISIPEITSKNIGEFFNYLHNHSIFGEKKSVAYDQLHENNRVVSRRIENAPDLVATFVVPEESGEQDPEESHRREEKKSDMNASGVKFLNETFGSQFRNSTDDNYLYLYNEKSIDFNEKQFNRDNNEVNSEILNTEDGLLDDQETYFPQSSKDECVTTMSRLSKIKREEDTLSTFCDEEKENVDNYKLEFIKKNFMATRFSSKEKEEIFDAIMNEATYELILAKYYDEADKTSIILPNCLYSKSESIKKNSDLNKKNSKLEQLAKINRSLYDLRPSFIEALLIIEAYFLENDNVNLKDPIVTSLKIDDFNISIMYSKDRSKFTLLKTKAFSKTLPCIVAHREYSCEEFCFKCCSSPVSCLYDKCIKRNYCCICPSESHCCGLCNKSIFDDECIRRECIGCYIDICCCKINFIEKFLEKTPFCYIPGSCCYCPSYAGWTVV